MSTLRALQRLICARCRVLGEREERYLPGQVRCYHDGHRAVEESKGRDRRVSFLSAASWAVSLRLLRLLRR